LLFNKTIAHARKHDGHNPKHVPEGKKKTDLYLRGKRKIKRHVREGKTKSANITKKERRD